MSFKKITLIYVIAFLVQLSLLNIFAIEGITPNLILCLTVVIIFVFENGFRSIPFGIITCLLLDICTGHYVGIGSLVIFATGIVVVWMRIHLNTDNVYPMIVTGAIATLLYGILYWIVLTITQVNYSFIFMIKYQIFFILYNVVTTVIMFYIMNGSVSRFIRNRYSV